MNFASALYISAAIVGVVVAFLGLSFRSAPGSSRYRALAAVGLTAAVYATLDCLWTTNISTPARFLAAGLQGSVAALHVVAWQWYTRKHLGLPETRLDRAFTAVLLLFAALWLVPGLMSSSRLIVLGVPWLGVTYRLPETALAGSIANAVETALLGVPLVRYLRSRRGGKEVDARVCRAPGWLVPASGGLRPATVARAPRDGGTAPA